MRPLPYRKPSLNRDYWIIDDVLADPLAVRERSLARTDWELGFPHADEAWPGMRVMPGLAAEELATVEAAARRATGIATLHQGLDRDGAKLNHNCVQIVGAVEGTLRPHTDSLDLCRYAGVLYLNPDAPASCGTGFYRQRLDAHRLGGNLVLAPHRNLVDALGTRHVPPGSFVEDVRIAHRFNRLLLYKANIVHSASAYWGFDGNASKRMTAVFFWMS